MHLIVGVFALWLTAVAGSEKACATGSNCVLLNECPSLYALSKQRPQTRHNRDLILKQQCGGTRTRGKVCCADNNNNSPKIESKIGEISLKHQKECTTPLNTTGHCLPLKDCLPLYKMTLSKPNLRQQNFLFNFRCPSEDHVFRVCCEIPIYPEIDTGNDILPVSPYLPTLEECGVQLGESRIFGGDKTLLTEFPWMALLQYQSDSELKFNCGGTLISKRYVLTAAHCVVGTAVHNTGKLVSVRLGEYNTETVEDCIINQGCNPPPQNIPIENVFPHEAYDSDEISKIYDIALIRLSRDAVFNRAVQPICLPNKGQEFSNYNHRLWVSGWGITEHYTTSDVKLKVRIPYQDLSMCQDKYRKIRNGHGVVFNSTCQFCAGGETGKDSCKGDSGGPVMFPLITTTFENKPKIKWFQTGIISLGLNRCGQTNIPSIYTKLNFFINWIVNKLH